MLLLMAEVRGCSGHWVCPAGGQTFPQAQSYQQDLLGYVSARPHGRPDSHWPQLGSVRIHGGSDDPAGDICICHAGQQPA